ncbi:MAG: AAA family ATPase [Polyangiaceae bacterium]|nr:AAA family ATPase [Polyangiaceae bacterium]
MMADANRSEAKPALASEPAWCEELRQRYLRGESSQFVLFGNVHDVVLYEGKLYGVSELLAEVVFARTKDTILVYNVSTGVRFTKRKADLRGAEDLVVQREPAKVLPLIERLFTTNDRIAAILEYADTVAPAGDTSFSTMEDRAAVVTIHRWSLLRTLERADSIIVLIVENLSELHPRIVSNPRVATVRVSMPSKSERAQIVAHTDPSLSAADVEHLSEITAGLKAIQLVSILTPSAAVDGDADRTRYVLELLAKGASPSPAVLERAQKLAAITKGMSFEEVRRLIAPDGESPSRAEDVRAEVGRLVAARKREIIERECFGLIEFVESQHGFDVVGGLDEVKRELATIAKNMREGRRNRCPMGLLFTGPMGTGKTFVAEAFARESGMTAIKLKNFRSKWVGATEGNLEKILHVIQAIGQIIVIIDEGDRAFGGSDGDGDGGTSSRVIGRIKEFMSDTENRGRVLFVLMTNRPDKLDVDIKRAGRLDRKIPFLYPQTQEEVERIVRAQLRKAKVTHEGPLDPALLSGIVGYSNADIEAIVLLAADHANAAREGDSVLTDEDLAAAVSDYLPSRDVKMIEYMELLAVFEASNRRMLPSKYAELSVDELQTKLVRLRAECGSRR